jgi:hypothetical protein
MKRRYSVCLVTSVLASMCVGIHAAATTEAGQAARPDQRRDMVTTLQAVNPNPSLGDEAKALARLVGTWDVEYTDFRKDGTELHRTGTFVVGWIMDGRALQDVWIVDPWGTHKDRELYTEVHYFDPKSRTWHATSVDPQEGSMARLTSTELAADRYVLETGDIGDKQTRWSFNDIRSDSFEWRDESSSDGGKTWRLQGHYHMKRRGT